MVVLWTMLACSGGLEETGPEGLVGRVLGPGGSPVDGVQIETLETRVRTDADGAFAIPWKPPNRLAHFQWQGLHYERPHRAQDDGRVVELRLPKTRAATVSCPPEACALELTWALSDGLRAVFRGRCESERTHALAAAPDTAPTAACRVGTGTARRDLPVDVVDRGGTLSVVPEATVVRVEVTTPDGTPLPDDCTVQLAGRLAQPVGEGQWAAEVDGPGAVSASCGGRPATPQRVDPAAQEGPVVLEWSPSGPSLDLEDRAPWLEMARLVAEDDGWSLSLAPDDGGVLHLPPLGAGRYRVLVLGKGAGAEALAVAPPADTPPGTVGLVAAGDAALVGALVLEEDRLDGRLNVTGP